MSTTLETATVASAERQRDRIARAGRWCLLAKGSLTIAVVAAGESVEDAARVCAGEQWDGGRTCQ